MKRRRMSRRGSRKYFTAGAGRVHKKNLLQGGLKVMRGGIRI